MSTEPRKVSFHAMFYSTVEITAKIRTDQTMQVAPE